MRVLWWAVPAAALVFVVFCALVFAAVLLAPLAVEESADPGDLAEHPVFDTPPPGARTFGSESIDGRGNPSGSSAHLQWVSASMPAPELRDWYAERFGLRRVEGGGDFTDGRLYCDDDLDGGVCIELFPGTPKELTDPGVLPARLPENVVSYALVTVAE
jgi:hypothetical protein